MNCTKHFASGAALLTVSLLLTACGGGSGGSGGGGTTDTTPPTVVSTSPANGASSVAITATVSATFSETMDCTTLTGATFSVSGANAVSGAVTCSGSSATFTPAASLAAGTSYTATLTTGVKDLAGNALAANHAWSFTTASAPKTWGAAVLIEGDNAGNVWLPKIAFDSNGNAFAVWTQSDGTRNNIWANRYTPGGGWGTAQLIETDDVSSAGNPQVAVDANGNAIAIWEQYDGVRYNIWANRYTAGSGWGTAVLIETDNAGHAIESHLAINASGNAVAVWHQSDGTRDNIWANHYTAGTGWGTAVLIETDNVGNALLPQVAINANGTAIAVWHQTDGTRNNIWANRYTPGSGWGIAELIETDNTGFAANPHVAIDVNGNAIAVWEQSDGTRSNIWANRYTPGSGWGVAGLIETGTGHADRPRVAFDANGNAIAVWEQQVGMQSGIWANRYTAGTGWGTAVRIESGTLNAVFPQVAFDANGNAIAVWTQHDGTRNNIWANRYAAGTGWGTAVLIEADPGDAGGVHVALDASGNAVAVWVQTDGSRYNVWANAYR